MPIMNTHPTFLVVDEECNNLFNIDYVPPIGSTLACHVSWYDVDQQLKFTEGELSWWDTMDGQYYEVINVYGEVNVVNGEESLTRFVEVKKIDKNKGNI